MADGDGGSTPRHVAIIMDGNGRWANARNLPRTAGHAQGEPALFDVIQGAVESGLEWLTVYAFSTENWSRSDDEVEFLMHFNIDLLRRRRDDMNEMGVRVRFIGDRDDRRVPDALRAEIEIAETMTAGNTTLNLVFAFNYGGRVELAEAARVLVTDALAGSIDAADVDVEALAARMYLPEMPGPDLVIRSSGEMRTSNFLVWQSAYSEYVFTEVLWPDFDRSTLADCIAEFQARDRRYGSSGPNMPRPSSRIQ